MAPPLSPRVLTPFTPSGAQPLDGYDKPPVYRLATATLVDRMRFEARLLGEAESPTLAAVLGAMEEGLAELGLDADEDAAARRLLDRAKARAAARSGDAQDLEADAFEPAEVEALVRLQGETAAVWPPLKRMLSASLEARLMRSALAAQFWLRGWENRPGKLRRDREGLASEDSLREIAPDDVLAIGVRALQLAYAGEADRKKAASSSGPGASPTSSGTSPDTPPAATAPAG